MARRGRPPRLNDAQRLELTAIVTTNPIATLEELQRRTRVKAHGQAIENVLREVGIERVRGNAGLRVKVGDEGQARYGSTDAHRRVELE